MDRASLYEEGRAFLQGRVGLALIVGLLASGLLFTVGTTAVLGDQWLIGACLTAVSAIVFLLTLIQLWRIYNAPILLITAELRQKRLVTAYYPIGFRQYRMVIRPLAAVRLEPDGAETPAAIANLPTDFQVNLADSTLVQEGDRIKLLCAPMLRYGLRVVERLERVDLPEELTPSQPDKATAASQPTPPPKNAAELYADYRSHIGGRAALTLLITLALSALFGPVAISGFFSPDTNLAETITVFLCIFSLGAVGWAFAAVYLWRLWRARPVRLTAVVLGRREDQRRSKGAIVRRIHYLRLRLIAAASFELTPDGQPAPASELPLPHPESEVEYNVMYHLFDQVAEGEQIELLAVPSLKRVIARLDQSVIK
jgi:hypothetical protein